MLSSDELIYILFLYNHYLHMLHCDLGYYAVLDSIQLNVLYIETYRILISEVKPNIYETQKMKKKNLYLSKMPYEIINKLCGMDY